MDKFLTWWFEGPRWRFIVVNVAWVAVLMAAVILGGMWMA